MDEQKFDFNKLKSFVFNSLGYLAVLLTSSVYVATALIRIGETGKTVAEIIANGAISFVFGVLVNHSFSLQGLISGGKDENVLLAEKKHQDLVYKISDRIALLQPWCETEMKRTYAVQRTKILARVGIRYDEVFDEDGVAKPYPQRYVDAMQVAKISKNKRLIKVEAKRYKSYLKALDLKLTPLSANELTTDSPKHDDPYYMGRTKAQYEKQTFAQSLITKVVTAIIFGYYGITLVENFVLQDLIWTLLQVCIFLLFGVVTLYQAYSYMTDEYRGRLVMKCDNLTKFDKETERMVKMDAEHKECKDEQRPD